MPDLVGLEVRAAGEVGHAAAVLVVSADVDGPPLGVLSWPGTWLVTRQQPAAGSSVARWDPVHITFRRADGDDAGDREPRLPSPSPDDRRAQATLDGEQQ